MVIINHCLRGFRISRFNFRLLPLPFHFLAVFASAYQANSFSGLGPGSLLRLEYTCVPLFSHFSLLLNVEKRGSLNKILREKPRRTKALKSLRKTSFHTWIQSNATILSRVGMESKYKELRKSKKQKCKKMRRSLPEPARNQSVGAVEILF